MHLKKEEIVNKLDSLLENGHLDKNEKDNVRTIMNHIILYYPERTEKDEKEK